MILLMACGNLLDDPQMVTALVCLLQQHA